MLEGSVIVGCPTLVPCVMVLSIFRELKQLGGLEGIIESQTRGIESYGIFA